MMMKYNVSFNIGVEQKALSQGFVLPIKIDFNKSPHLLLSAPTGSGKTYALKYILQQLRGTIYLCDFKGIDFISMHECKHYFKHQAVQEGLNKAFNLLQIRMSIPRKNFYPIYLVFDEFAGFLASLPKKEQEEYKQKLASLLMLGRGCSIYCIVALQRADSSNFLAGARDNFGNVLGLGTLSKEAIRMLFPDDTDLIEPKTRGKGYLRIDGQPLTEIVIPTLRDVDRTDMKIRWSLIPPIKGSDENI